MSARSVHARAPRRRAFVVSLTLLLAVLGALGYAFAQDQFAFMPPSGPEVLTQVLETCAECDDLATLRSMELDADGWRAYFEERGVLAELDEDQATLLVSYLSLNLPSTAGSMPMGGRDMAIFNCQLCHSIAVPMTQDRDLQRWMEHRDMAPHDGLSLTSVQWDTLAQYLTIAAPLPLEAIPEPLRRGAGGY